MRKETVQLIDDSIYYCLINPINDCGIDEFNGGKELELNNCSKICYEELMTMSEDTYGYSKAIRFDGKKNIMSLLKSRIKELLKSELNIQIKES